MSGVEILIDGSNGVYIPQIFGRNFIGGWATGSVWDIDVIKEGPDNDSYWNVWDWIVSNATHVDKHGNVWRLWQDSDLFAICEELMTDEEYLQFFDVER